MPGGACALSKLLRGNPRRQRQLRASEGRLLALVLWEGGCLRGPGGPGSSGSRGSEPFADLSPFSLWTSGRGGADAPQVQHLPPALLAVAQTPLLNLSVAGGVKTPQ